MTAADLVESATAPMTQPAKSPEPSMEEILASIRRIIADDEIEKPATSSEVASVALKPEPVPAPAVLRPIAVPPKAQPVPVELFQDTPATEPLPPEPFVQTPPVSAPSAEVADILELTEEMRTPEASAPIPFRTIEAQPDVIFAESTSEARPVTPAAQEETTVATLEHVRQTLTESLDHQLMSNSTSAAVDSAFSSLAHTVLTHNARTLDDLVKDMLRPMLKSWLDDNLPGLVERLVRAEIERVSRGR